MLLAAASLATADQLFDVTCVAYVTYVTHVTQVRPTTADQLFDELDEDGNGVLDLSELKTGLRKLRQAATGTLATR